MTQKLSTLQLELLKIYSFNPDEKDLLEIKAYLARFFANKLVDKIDHAIEEKGISESDLDAWLNEG